MVRICAIFLTLCAAIAAVLPATADATFPGRNGDLIYLDVGGYKASDYSGAVVRLPADGRSERPLWECASGGSSSRRGGTGTATPYAVQPCWGLEGLSASPDGRSIALSSYDSTAPSWMGQPFVPRVHVLSLVGLPERILPLGGLPIGPLWWAPDGSGLIGWGAPFEGAAPLFHTLTLDGTGPVPWRPGPTGAADWSVDGAVASIEGGQLYVSRPDAAPRRLTQRGADEPSFSPDGRWIAYSRGCRSDGPAKGCGVFVVRTTGGPASKIASNGVEPVWSPDGRHIAFMQSTTWYDTYTDYLVVRACVARGKNGWRAVSLRRLQEGTSRWKTNRSYGPAELDWLPAF